MTAVRYTLHPDLDALVRLRDENRHAPAYASFGIIVALRTYATAREMRDAAAWLSQRADEKEARDGAR